ncbi:Tex family protein [Albibacterium indicum]|uniref:Tex family protein n=1 Tax=Albibacterium indicum TaxID=2292082 RepID=UPI001980E39E|nr:Tex family protein [Pedobacter indicus]
MTYEVRISKELGLALSQVKNTIGLLEDSATIPFIARYRKELTKGLDEVQITAIRDLQKRLQDIDKRRDAIIKSIEEQQKMTPDLLERLNNADSLSILEDVYLPYKPKRRTRATIAREKKLQGLADRLLEQKAGSVKELAEGYINTELAVTDTEEALAGARDILAELFSESAVVRAAIRNLFLNNGAYKSTLVEGKEEQAQKYKDYFDWQEPVKTIASHRLLAMRRGEREEFLRLDLSVEEVDALGVLRKEFVKAKNEASEQVDMAIQDSYKRLIKPSIETEVRVLSRQKADEEAIAVFAENARQLLLAAPLGQKRLLAIDPGFRTGCKMVCLDEQGKLLYNSTIYPHNGEDKLKDSSRIVQNVIEQYNIEAIAIGNGTAGRETELFIRNLAPSTVTVVMVNENGASIYSASAVAREEFPDYDITVRGAVSIGRRLMDPLAELVKIDPKSIGVGQYQHDVDQTKLQTSLDDTVSSCVNSVGVSLNTASKQILSYVSGLGPALAQNIVKYRDENGPFRNRQDLKKVPRLGDKAFEQAAGFLRITNAENPLDASAVHPERYSLIENMASDLNSSVADLLKDEEKRKRIELKNYVTDEVGLPTLNDILTELAKPGRDPREQFEAFSFAEGVNGIEDLKVGMKLPGIVTNITNFGAFVDIGVHQDGLVHLSQLANKFVKDANEIVKVNQQVEVKVTEVDVARNRISLSMKDDQPAVPVRTKKSIERNKDGMSSRSGQSQKKNTKKTFKKRSAREEQSDMQSKLAALKAKFG